MAKIYDTSIDLKKNQTINRVIENRTTSSASPVVGQEWYRIDDVTNGTTGRVVINTSSGERKVAYLDDISTATGNYIPTSQKGVAGGVATLDGSGLIPTSQLPSYVDDVLEFSALANFPSTGETGKVYVASDTNKTYRWSGSAYVELGVSIVLGNITPSDISTSAAVGSSGAAAKADHTHKLGTRVVSGSSIQLSTILSENLSDGSVTSGKIYDGSISTAKIANNAVDNTKLATMSSYTVKMNNSASQATPQDVSLSSLGTTLASQSSDLGAVKTYSNPSLTPSGGQCTWSINGALNSAKKRLGYYVPIIQIWEVGTTNRPTEMDINIDNSTGNITIYFNSTASVAANKYIARISE